MNFYSNKKPEKTEDMFLIELINSTSGKIAVPLKKTICVFKESESSVLLKYKDKILKKYSTFNDFYGSSIDSAIEEALRLEKIYEIEKKSGLVFVVNTEFSTKYAIPSLEKNRYDWIPNNWILNTEDSNELVLLFNKGNLTDLEMERFVFLKNKLSLEKKIDRTLDTWNSIKKEKSM